MVEKYFTNFDINLFKTKEENFTIKSPPKVLNDIYIFTGFVETLGVRAEYYYSIENINKYNTKEIHVLNENYIKIFYIINKIINNNDNNENFNDLLNITQNILNDIKKKFEYKKEVWKNYIPDIRVLDNINDILNYIYNKYVII